MAERYDLIVIGAGPGGYVGAIRASQLGMKVACVEKRSTLGGTCLNIGCIPSKALLDSSEWFAQARGKFAHHGIVCDGLRLDLPAMMSRKDTVVKGLTQGVAGLFKKNRITRVQGHARLRDPHTVEITADDGTQQTVQANAIVIATGSEPIALPMLPFDGQRVLSSTEALSLPEVPQHLIVIGGGAVGLALGSVWLRLGAQETAVGLLPPLLPRADAPIPPGPPRAATKEGVFLLLRSRAAP